MTNEFEYARMCPQAKALSFCRDPEHRNFKTPVLDENVWSQRCHNLADFPPKQTMSCTLHTSVDMSLLALEWNSRLGGPLDEIVLFSVHKFSVLMLHCNLVMWLHSRAWKPLPCRVTLLRDSFVVPYTRATHL